MPTKVTPADDYEAKGFTFQGEFFGVKTKFKMLKFFREITENPVNALELAMDPEDFDRLLELDITMDDFKVILEGISEALAGTTSGN